MATYVQTKPLRKQLRSNKSRFGTFALVNYKWDCARIRIYIGVSSRIRSMKRHNCFIPVRPVVTPAR